MTPRAGTILLLCAVFGAAAADKPTRPTVDALEQALVDRQVWLNNKIGVSDKVPAPWTPLTAERTGPRSCVLQMLGRAYRFENSLFPAQIEAWGTPVLAGPIRLVAVVGSGRAQAPKSDGVKVTKRRPAEVELVACGELNGLDVCASHRLEYDGMLWTRLSLCPGAGPVRLANVRLEIPLRPAAAAYLNHNFFRGESKATSNIMGRMEPLPFKTCFKPCIWLGNDDVGLCWFAESDQGWDRAAPLTDQVELLDAGGARVLRLNLLRTPHELRSSHEFSFGLMATPPKPVKPGWRADPALFTAGFSDFSWDRGGYYPAPDPAKVEAGKFAGLLETPTHYFKTSFCYFGIKSYRGDWIAPECWLFGREWEMIGAEAAERLTRPQPPETRVSTMRGSPLSTQTDWLLWKWDQLVKRHKMKNIYFDSLGGPDINPLHGAGYVAADGTVLATHNILAMRTALKRFYVMMSENLGDFNIMIHGGSAVPPVLSFAHLHLTGEQFIIDPRRVQAHYTEVTPIEEWRGFFKGSQFGVIGVFLPELQERYRLYRAPTDEMMLLALLHDVVVIKAFCNSGAVGQPQTALAQYGMQDMEFVPYWRSGPFAAASHPDVHLSLWRDPGRKRAVLVLGNPGGSHRDVVVTLTDPGLRSGAVTARDLLHEETFPVQSGRIAVAVGKRHYRLVAIQAE